MTNPFQKVKAGDDLVISAAVYNAMLDAAVANMRGGAIPSSRSEHAQNVIHVRNDTEQKLHFGNAVGVVSPLFMVPQDDANQEEHYRHFVDRNYTAVKPTDDLTLGITLEPIAIGEIGRVALSGIVRAIVDVKDTAHTTVTFTAGTVNLESSDDGQLSYLIKPLSTGKQWCDLVFGVSGGAPVSGGLANWGTLTSSLEAGKFAYVETLGGDSKDGKNVLVYMQPNMINVLLKQGTPVSIIPAVPYTQKFNNKDVTAHWTIEKANFSANYDMQSSPNVTVAYNSSNTEATLTVNNTDSVHPNSEKFLVADVDSQKMTGNTVTVKYPAIFAAYVNPVAADYGDNVKNIENTASDSVLCFTSQLASNCINATSTGNASVLNPTIIPYNGKITLSTPDIPEKARPLYKVEYRFSAVAYKNYATAIRPDDFPKRNVPYRLESRLIYKNEYTLAAKDLGWYQAEEEPQ